MSDFDSFVRFHLISLHAQLERLKYSIGEYGKREPKVDEKISKISLDIDEILRRIDRKMPFLGPETATTTDTQFTALINSIVDKRKVMVETGPLDQLK